MHILFLLIACIGTSAPPPAPAPAPVAEPVSASTTVTEPANAATEAPATGFEGIVVDIAIVAGSEAVLVDLRALEFKANTYGEDEGEGPEGAGGIWVGCRVPADAVVAAIGAGRKHWPMLRYVALSCDDSTSPPDFIHDELFLGGSSSTALQHSDTAWSTADFEALQPGMGKDALHAKIRTLQGER